MSDENKPETKAADLSDKSGVERGQIGAIVFEGMRSFAESSVASATTEYKAMLRAEYQTAVEMVKLLSDIRFRCLVFVTAIIAIANALLPNTGLPGPRIALGFVGFFTTFGIAVYELRNSQLYEAAIHRAKFLEKRLGVPSSTWRITVGGLFNERPHYVEQKYGEDLSNKAWSKPARYKVQLMPFLFVKVKHDQGLALIYGAVLGGWSYLITHGLVSFLVSIGCWPTRPARSVGLTAAILGFAVSVIAWHRFLKHDSTRFRLTEEKPEPEAAAPESNQEPTIRSM